MVSALETKIAEKIQWAFEDGCPIAPYDNDRALEMAIYMRRRWNSYLLRNKQKKCSQVFDLAKGLATTYTEGGFPMVGPLIEDYKWLSEQVAPLMG